MLEGTVKLLQNRAVSSNVEKTETQTTEVQTDDLERLWCNESEYPAKDIYNLGEHMYTVHAEDNTDYKISCHYCGNFFRSKSDVMLHSKKVHLERLQPCRNFPEGNCDFTSTDCWFSHETSAHKKIHSYKCS